MTAYDPGPTTLKASKYGVFSFLRLPVQPTEVVGTAETALQASWWRSLWEMPVELSIVDSNYVIVRSNIEKDRNFGYDGRGLEGNICWKVFECNEHGNPRAAPCPDCPAKEAMRLRKAITTHWSFLHPLEPQAARTRLHDIQLVEIPIFNYAGGAVAALELVIDMTHFREVALSPVRYWRADAQDVYKTIVDDLVDVVGFRCARVYECRNVGGKPMFYGNASRGIGIDGTFEGLPLDPESDEPSADLLREKTAALCVYKDSEAFASGLERRYCRYYDRRRYAKELEKEDVDAWIEVPVIDSHGEVVGKISLVSKQRVPELKELFYANVYAACVSRVHEQVRLANERDVDLKALSALTGELSESRDIESVQRTLLAYVARVTPAGSMMRFYGYVPALSPGEAVGAALVADVEGGVVAEAHLQLREGGLETLRTDFDRV